MEKRKFFYIGSATEGQPNCAATPTGTSVVTSYATEASIKLTTFHHPERTLTPGPMPTDSWPNYTPDTMEACGSDDTTFPSESTDLATTDWIGPEETSSFTSPPSASKPTVSSTQTGNTKSGSGRTYYLYDGVICALMLILFFMFLFL
jgi:hypothetical protein